MCQQCGHLSIQNSSKSGLGVLALLGFHHYLHHLRSKSLSLRSVDIALLCCTTSNMANAWLMCLCKGASLNSLPGLPAGRRLLVLLVALCSLIPAWHIGRLSPKAWTARRAKAARAAW